MAQIAFDNGVDLILGHSAHQLHGIEIIDGKAVIYDMGNLLFDVQLFHIPGRYSAIFRLHISEKGVHKIEALPIRIKEGYTKQASEKESGVILNNLVKQCRSLDTKMEVVKDPDEGLKGIIRIKKPRVTPKDTKRTDLEFIRFKNTEDFETTPASELMVDKLPAEAKRLIPPKEVALGIELLGYSIPNTVTQDTILQITTWWRVKKRINKHWLISYQLDTGRYFRKGTSWYTRHDPGDWAIPFSEMEPGQIFVDSYPARITRAGTGNIKVYVMLFEPSGSSEGAVIGKKSFLGNVDIIPRR
jgi:hypothetical protein